MIIPGVRPEHFRMSTAGDPAAIPCTVKVNGMMGSELHLHVETASGDRLIVRISTVSPDDELRHSMVCGATIYVTLEGKVMHFFAPETRQNLSV